MIAVYRDGSVADAARAVGVTLAAAHKHLLRAGVMRSRREGNRASHARRRPELPRLRERAREMFEAGASASEAARELGVHVSTTGAWLRELLGPMPKRPRVRGDCAGGPRPCPWVSCRHHLGIELVNVGGARRELVLIGGCRGETDQPSCSLDLADANPHGMQLAAVGAVLGVTRERIRQIEAKALRELRAKPSPDVTVELSGKQGSRRAL